MGYTDSEKNGRTTVREDAGGKEDNQKNPIRKIDEAGNWTERFEGCNEYGEPNFIIRRDIEYADGGNDWEKIPVRGKVKKVQQRSYVAIAKGPQAVDKERRKDSSSFTSLVKTDGK